MNTSIISVLSAGSIEPGLVDAVAAFNRLGGNTARITWATAPAIRQRVANGEVADVVIVPDATVEAFAQQRKVFAEQKVRVGRVGIGVVMRAELDAPALADVAALERAVLEAESVVFNRASSGLYIESLFRKMGIYERIRGKTVRHDDGPAMMAHLIAGRGHDIGFGAIIEIRMFAERGLKLAAALPPELQHWTTYFAVPMTAATNVGGARAFLNYLATAPAQALFSAHGIE